MLKLLLLPLLLLLCAPIARALMPTAWPSRGSALYTVMGLKAAFSLMSGDPSVTMRSFHSANALRTRRPWLCASPTLMRSARSARKATSPIHASTHADKSWRRWAVWTCSSAC